MNILLVDDEVTMLEILRTVVPWETIGIRNVYTARNAAEARSVIEEKKIDIAVCDIEMPRENGLDLIAWIQGLYPHIVNIILTGHADFNYARNAVSLGVYEYLLKPVAFDELEEVVRRAVRKREEEMTPEVTIPEIREDSHVLQVRAYLENHYNEVITRHDIEKLVNLNQDHINREFKAYSGYTLMEYIQHLRIQAARKLLSESRESVASISTAVGYDSPAYFSKIFKRATGMTPVEYRMKESVLL